jgi:hypothetical protein
MADKNIQENYLCSFCGKSTDEVEVLIVSSDANICNECIGKCNEVIEDHHKRRKTVEVLGKITEPQLIRFLMANEGVFHWTLDFMLQGAFEHIGPVIIPPKPDFDSLLIALEVPRDELQLNPDQAPGDIDMLIVPRNEDHILYGKTMAVEVKVVRPTIEKPSKNANSLGQTQSNKLVKGGFPYVGLLHLIIPEPSPEYMLTELTVRTASGFKHLKEGRPAPPPPKKEKFDLFPVYATERQLGRLKKMRLPDFVGFNPVDLSIRAKEENGQTYLTIISYGIQQHREAKRNPNCSQETLRLIEEHYKKHSYRYLDVKWFA